MSATNACTFCHTEHVGHVFVSLEPDGDWAEVQVCAMCKDEIRRAIDPGESPSNTLDNFAEDAEVRD